jgi:hypothetical protein
MVVVAQVAEAKEDTEVAAGVQQFDWELAQQI